MVFGRLVKCVVPKHPVLSTQYPVLNELARRGDDYDYSIRQRLSEEVF